MSEAANLIHLSTLTLTRIQFGITVSLEAALKAKRNDDDLDKVGPSGPTGKQKRKHRKEIGQTSSGPYGVPSEIQTETNLAAPYFSLFGLAYVDHESG